MAHNNQWKNRKLNNTSSRLEWFYRVRWKSAGPVAIISVLFLAPGLALAQGDNPAINSLAGHPATLFPHPIDSRWWISGQINLILQGHPAFPAKYTGTHSVRTNGEIRNSRVLTLYTGLTITRLTEVFAVLESAGGHGLSGAVGLAGLTNADVVRNPELGPAPYVARILVRQIVPLSRELTTQERGPLALQTQIPVRRLEIRAGKLALPDSFDVNSVGSDDHLQFMNLTAVSNAAWQYAGDSRGYTYGLLLEYVDRSYSLRFAEALMPTLPNGTDVDWNLRRAHAENLEFEYRPALPRKRPTAVRLLAFVNHSNCGSYSDAIKLYQEGETPRPNIEVTRQQGRIKYGFGVNIEHEVADGLRAFARFGWDDSRFESFEVSQNFDLGADYSGSRWRRSRDKIGVAVLSNAIARNVQRYLMLGGTGILLGDGALRYGRENIVETYYNLHIWRGVYAAFDLQHVWNPGYNQDRGPVWVPSLRLHLEL